MQRKQVLILYGSPNDNGFTKQLLDEFIKLTPKDYSYILFDTYKKDIKPCKGCAKCVDTGECVYRDMDELDSIICTCDAIIVATPIHNLTFTPPLASVLGRFQKYFYRMRTEKEQGQNSLSTFSKKKKAILLLTCGSNCFYGKKIIEQQIKLIFRTINAELKDTVLWPNTDFPSDISKYYSNMKRAAKHFKYI